MTGSETYANPYWAMKMAADRWEAARGGERSDYLPLDTGGSRVGGGSKVKLMTRSRGQLDGDVIA